MTIKKINNTVILSEERYLELLGAAKVVKKKKPKSGSYEEDKIRLRQLRRFIKDLKKMSLWELIKFKNNLK